MDYQISLIVPIYNVPERYLRRCIESICNQTIKNIEIILVDDGSTNGSAEICDSYSSKDERITVIHKDNGGLSSARNAGFSKACADWIMFVDGDDWIEPNTCELMYKEANEYDVELVMCAICKDYGNRIEEFKFPFDDFELFDEAGCKDLQARILDFNSYIACVYAKLIKRAYLIHFRMMKIFF